MPETEADVEERERLGPYLTPTGAPCPRTVRVDGTVEGSGMCLGCGTCLLFGGLFEQHP